jgi:hypothetical protein
VLVQFLRRNWVGLMFCAFGLLLVAVFPILLRREHRYRTAPECRSETPSRDCRFQTQASVIGVEHHGSGSERLEFELLVGTDRYDPQFSTDDLRPGIVETGQTIAVEIWRGKVVAITVGSDTYRSLYLQPIPWWLVPGGLVLLTLGVVMMRTGTAGTSATPLP